MGKADPTCRFRIARLAFRLQPHGDDMRLETRISSEGGVTALLGATAGFFISQSQLLNADTPYGGLKAGVLLALYCMIFAAIPLGYSAKRLQGGSRYLQIGLAISIVIAGYSQLIPALIDVTISEEGGNWAFKDNFAIPLLFTPLIWFFMFSIDELYSWASLKVQVSA